MGKIIATFNDEKNLPQCFKRSYKSIRKTHTQALETENQVNSTNRKHTYTHPPTLLSHPRPPTQKYSWTRHKEKK